MLEDEETENIEDTYSSDLEDEMNVENNEEPYSDGNDNSNTGEDVDEEIEDEAFETMPENYFENTTSMLMFCWISKHNICAFELNYCFIFNVMVYYIITTELIYIATSAYDDLIDILHHQDFKVSDTVKNVRRFRNYRKRLPLPTIYSKPISISTKKTPSTLQNTKNSYHLSIKDLIWNVLNNPHLRKQMYFGPGILCENKKEFWHGDLWAESPLFGCEEIIINNGM